MTLERDREKPRYFRTALETKFINILKRMSVIVSRPLSFYIKLTACGSALRERANA